MGGEVIPLRVYLEPAGQKLVLHFQVVALVDLRFKGLVEDCVTWIILNVLPAGIAMPGGTVKGKAGHRNEGLDSRGEVGATRFPACCLASQRLSCKTSTPVTMTTVTLAGNDRCQEGH